MNGLFEINVTVHKKEKLSVWDSVCVLPTLQFFLIKVFTIVAQNSLMLRCGFKVNVKVVSKTYDKVRLRNCFPTIYRD